MQARQSKHIVLLGLALLLFGETFAEQGHVPSTSYSVKPQRVLSLVPALTECIYAIGAEDCLVGVSSFCIYPKQARELPQLGALLDPNWEVILSLDADLLLLDQADQSNQNRARDLAIPVLALDQSTLSGVLSGFETLGRALGQAQAGQELRQTIQSQLIQRPQSESPMRVLLVADRVEKRGLPAAVWALGQGSWLSELLYLAGGSNVISESQATSTLSTEGLIALDLDLVIEFWPSDLGPPRPMTEWLSDWEALGEFTEVPMAVALQDDAILRPGPRLLEAYRALCMILDQTSRADQ